MMIHAAWALGLMLVCLAGCAAGGVKVVGEAKVVVQESPAGENLSQDFEVWVAGKKVPVYACRVSAMPFNRLWPGHQRSLDQTELASFAYWDMAAGAEVEVASVRAVQSVDIRPASRGIQANVEGNRIKFHMSAAGQVVVEVNGYHRVLHLFANPMEAKSVDAGAAGVRYFGPGVHEAGRIELKDDETVYIAAGAVVHGAIEAKGAKNVKILGRGILDGSKFERGEKGAPHGCVRLTDCTGAVIDGVILRDPNVWCCTLSGCSGAVISNVKVIGLWRYNADGIDICNCQNVVVRDCFVRSYDDSIVVKGLHFKGGGEEKPVRNILAERCVIWCDWGRALEIGAETAAPVMENITFRDCDIVRTNYAALDIQHGDRAAIRNVLYENIRLEVDDVSYTAIMQKSDEDPYVADATWVPRLLIVEIVKTGWNKDSARGTVEGVVLSGIDVRSKAMPWSRLSGFDAEHAVKGVRIEGLRWNGRTLSSLAEAQVVVKDFVEGVEIVGR